MTAIAAAAVLWSGCATPPKQVSNTAPMPAGGTGTGTNEFLKGMEVVEKPELEPEWGTFVKENYPSWRQHYWVDRGQWGNRGYLVGRPPTNADTGVADTTLTPVPAVPMVEQVPPTAPTIVESEPPKVAKPNRPTSYVVKKGDSLWKIAGKVYGDPLKWPRIYRANKTKLKSANKIMPGQVLVIPQN